MGNSSNKDQLTDDSFYFIQNTVDSNYGESRIYKKKGRNDLYAIISRAGGGIYADRKI